MNVIIIMIIGFILFVKLKILKKNIKFVVEGVIKKTNPFNKIDKKSNKYCTYILYNYELNFY